MRFYQVEEILKNHTKTKLTGNLDSLENNTVFML